jgi:phosphoribosyl 1,2-cyclic phosphodiesterase
MDYLLRRLNELSVAPSSVDAVLLTHGHGDHVSGVAAFAGRFGVPVYVRREAERGICARLKKLNRALFVVFDSSDFFIKDITITPIELPHDVPCTGFCLFSEGERIGIATDLGRVTPEILLRLAPCGVVLLEANHDTELLCASRSYPRALKRRIMSPCGHLSNAACAEAVARLCLSGALKRVILAHLSAENNYPELAVGTVRAYLERNGIDSGGIDIITAAQYGVTGFIGAGAPAAHIVEAV